MSSLSDEISYIMANFLRLRLTQNGTKFLVNFTCHLSLHMIMEMTTFTSNIRLKKDICQNINLKEQYFFLNSKTF